MASNADEPFVPDVNLAEFQIERMKVHGKSVALVDAHTEELYTYADVIDRIYRLAAGLRELGLRQGDVLCTFLNNTIELPIIIYSVNLLGAILQTASPAYTDDDLERRFKECHTKFLITTPDQGKRVLNLIQNIKLKSFSASKPSLLNKIITLGDADGFITYDSLFTEARVTQAARVNTMTTPAFLLSSSGTTGLPKYVQLSHRNAVADIPEQAETYQFRPGTCTILTVPMYHHYGIMNGISVGMYSGLKIVVMERYNFEEYLRLIELHKAEILPLVPPIAVRLVKRANVHSHDLSSVKYIQTAAAPLSVEVERQLLQMFNLKFVAQVYGLTETGLLSANSVDHFRVGSSGQVKKGVELKVIDQKTGEPLPPTQTGEIIVKGAKITIGYFANPQATKNAFDKDGYFRTGDLGYIDKDGYLFIVDRLKELIKYKGLQVAPAFLEDILMTHPGVADAAVIGVTDPEAGELPKAFVVPKPGSTVTPADICKHVEDRVAPHMRLRGGAELVDSIPKTASGKILRRLLRHRGSKAKL